MKRGVDKTKKGLEKKPNSTTTIFLKLKKNETLRLNKKKQFFNGQNICTDISPKIYING